VESVVGKKHIAENGVVGRMRAGGSPADYRCRDLNGPVVQLKSTGVLAQRLFSTAVRGGSA
jgi:hypothetical protein